MVALKNEVEEWHCENPFSGAQWRREEGSGVRKKVASVERGWRR